MSSNLDKAKLLYVITYGPYSCAQGQEALDAILIGASFEQDISVLFMHDGVFQLKSLQGKSSAAKKPSHQNNNAESRLKIYTKTYKALDDFGVDKIYVHDLSMLARGLTEEQLIIKAQNLSSSDVSDLLSQQARVFTF